MTPTKPENALVEKDRLDRVNLEQCFTNDPVERLVGEALTAAGFEWQHEGHPERRYDPVRLDFAIVGGPYVEVKRFHAERCAAQLATAENVILVQGIEAARWFADAITTLLERERRAAEALTPSAETKAAYIGEFSFTIEDTDDEWGLPITRKFDVPWTTIKEIMAAIKARAALTGEGE